MLGTTGVQMDINSEPRGRAMNVFYIMSCVIRVWQIYQHRDQSILKSKLGAPRLPPYTPNPYLWLLPIGILVGLYIFSRMRKKQSETGTFCHQHDFTVL